ncbi:type VII secretion target [Mycobacterium hubeiense]|uniref:type VII secretion target n=1 Tax=Mycobacterium hubeiense TaxID=1867256 RepID=UPI000C7EC9D8|nr:type VII secretion target [Mycobacterium sp. QGD 101]
MSDQLDVDLGRLPQHATDHQAIAAKWLEWPAGGESFLAAFRRTHGVVAEPVARVLEQYQQRRVQFGGAQADMNKTVSDAITTSLGTFRTMEADSSRRLTAPVQDL